MSQVIEFNSGSKISFNNTQSVSDKVVLWTAKTLQNFAATLSKFEKEGKKEYSSSMFALRDTNRAEGEDKIRLCSCSSNPQELFQIF